MTPAGSGDPDGMREAVDQGEDPGRLSQSPGAAPMELGRGLRGNPGATLTAMIRTAR